MNRYIRILFGILFFSLTTYSVAQMTVSGTVTDASTGEALAGANVVVDGTSKGAAADASGSFSIANVPDGTYEIVAWQEKFGSKRTLSQSVTVKSGEAVVNFEFSRPKKK